MIRTTLAPLSILFFFVFGWGVGLHGGRFGRVFFFVRLLHREGISEAFTNIIYTTFSAS
jgi:hypothetical protein